MKLIVSIALLTCLYSQNNLKVPTLSPITKISQQVALTEVELSYSRPLALGRE